jgi:hypothetical protein
MAEYSRMAKGHYTAAASGPTGQVVNLPFQPTRVEFTNFTLANSAAASQNIVRAFWDVSMGQGVTVVEGYNATPALIFDVVPTNGISTFAAGQLLQYGPVYAHNSVASADFSITAASPAVVTTATAHGLVSGNVIVFSNLYQSSTTGMQQMAGVPLTVSVTSPTVFQVNWNASGSNYTAFNTATSTGNVGSWKQVLYPYLYCPEQTVITGINRTLNEQFTGAANTIQTAAAHNFQVGQEVAFRIPTAWGTTQLNSLPDIPIPGSPIYWYVIAVTQNTFTVSQSSNNPNGSLSGFTAFNPNQTFASFPGLKMPQVVPAGDVNTGGAVITAGSPLYPSPQVYSGFTNSLAPTINGPAIQGAFVNNTSQGFIIGPGAGRVLTTASLSGLNSNVIYWVAYLDDLVIN